MDKWTAGGIFFAGMATTYLLQKTKVLGAENNLPFAENKGLRRRKSGI